jgi:hypothetical protein
MPLSALFGGRIHYNFVAIEVCFLL